MVDKNENNDDMVSLGENIELSGFRDVEDPVMAVLKKILGTYSRKFSESSSGFEGMSMKMKKVHAQRRSEKYEIHASVSVSGKLYTSEVTDRNMFFAADSALRKVEQEIKK
jgi:ribosome-associated translation inhibitor RaiA